MLGFGCVGEFSLAEFEFTTASQAGEAIDVYAPGGGRKRRRRDGDEELTEAELQWMFRKIAELKAARAQEEKDRFAKQLEVALAQAAQDEEAAEVIKETIAIEIPQLRDYSEVMRSIATLDAILKNLQQMLRDGEEDDIEVLLLSQ